MSDGFSGFNASSLNLESLNEIGANIIGAVMSTVQTAGPAFSALMENFGPNIESIMNKIGDANMVAIKDALPAMGAVWTAVMPQVEEMMKNAIPMVQGLVEQTVAGVVNR